ncbi:MAG: hypothetical protein LBF95_06650 [Treponema sp.]|jgi:hypothetical protein|nr:hypothetical protein [Treponema sp.]
MLYPKREKPLSVEDFKNPGSEYRATPFWAWNTRLDKDDLVWQIEQLKKLGYGGFHMHVRTGMATDYLSDEYMACVRACVEKARQERMLAWLYDEDRWPSGAAGGLVTRQEQYRIRHLLLTRRPYGGHGEVKANQDSSAASERAENGVLVGCFDVTLDRRGELEHYHAIGEGDTARGIKLYAYAETALPSPWYNNQTYANTLDPATIREFIRVTHERYRKDFSADFGALIPAIFTDEPQFSRKGTLNYALEEKDVTLPWTLDIEDSYRAAYGGESLVAGLPELLWNLPGGRVSIIRYHYHDHIAERFAAAFADQCGAWCASNGLMLTGHMMEEPTLESQTHALGEAMRSYRSFQLPGIDMLCDSREFTTAKQAQSAARQMGSPGVLSELYGVTNWDFDFRGHKLQGDWQAALGVTVRVPHLSWVSMNGEAKRDYPATFNYQAPWYKEYPYVEDHFARLASTLTRGQALCRVGVIHPIESYWLHWGPRENTQAIRGEMDENFTRLCDWLLRGLIDFDYVCESTLPRYCDPKNITAPASGKALFPVGQMGYELIIVPALETVRTGTLERLEAFRRAGGRIIFLGKPPAYVDARPGERGRKLWEACEHIAFERLPVLDALEALRDLEVRDDSGVRTSDLLYQIRDEGNGGPRWLFIARADRPVNADIPRPQRLRVSIRGEWAVSLYDTLNGGITPLAARQEEGRTTLALTFYEHDSLLVRLDPGAGTTSGPAAGATVDAVLSRRPAEARRHAEKVQRFTGPVPITLEEPNVLLLDMAEFALDTGAYRPREEVLRLDSLLRDELNWPSRGDAWAQPWVETDKTTPHTLRLRYNIDSELEIQGTELALENAAAARVTLNGEAALPTRLWYVDKCIGRVKLPPIKRGSNVLEVSLPYGRAIDVEAMYLLGDFGVRVAGSFATLTPPVRTLAFGDISRQGLPFYGGNLVYHLEAETRASELLVGVTYYRGHLLRVRVDGADRGVIAYSPYELRVPGLSPGKHQVDIVYFGSRINTFGQLHSNARGGYWWGPGSWRTQGAGWNYEYHFWPQGVLKSPELS